MFKTFKKGGIHPPEYKLSAHEKIKVADVPAAVSIFVSQHMGAPAKVIVETGQKVKAGQLIAVGEGFVSSNVHASVSGIVSKIEDIYDGVGFKRKAVCINAEGDEWLDDIITNSELDNTIHDSGAEIIKKITEAGIVGLGGATFPSHVKLAIPRGKKAQYLIINGVECEPYLTSDHALMREKGAEIITGVRLLMKALDVQDAHIGIENNKPDAIENMRRLASGYPEIHIHPLKVKYPQGGEKQLIKAITGREVPSGGLPVDVGAIVFNVGTAFAVYEAVQKNKPLVERIVTVTGKNMTQPSNFKARIGTPVSALIQLAGGLPENSGKVIIGGPMMGKSISNSDVPVVKGTSGILLLPADESERNPVQPCVRCAKCVSVCPMGLEPYLLLQLAQQNFFDRLEAAHVMDCVECGSCSYTCPASRPLLDYIRHGKTSVGKIIRSRIKQ